MNLLSKETSPYLLQHAHNPVDWYPWGEEAFAKARAEDKPLLVSIGYSTCHWCHVMERESFEDEETAAFMNERFVCVKVDREERPDVDHIYMDVCQSINGSGGWPLNAFLLPDGRAFYAGTYYPPEPKYNRPSWRQLLDYLYRTYKEEREKAEEQAASLLKGISAGAGRMLDVPGGGEEDGERLLLAGARLLEGINPGTGGFGGAPKFPMSQPLEALLAYAVLHEKPHAGHLVHHSLKAMLDGGIYDQLGGGFSRYTVDANWRVPHFEKMLYDNALLLRLLAKCHMHRPDARYAAAIAETTDWLLREMQMDNGGYRAALDADSEGVEGKYYVWDRVELDALLTEDDAALVADFYGITGPGNWVEEETNIPYRAMTLDAAAAEHGLTVETAREKIAAAREVLHRYRLTRIPPGRDDKLILQWNALLVSGWYWAYRATGEARYRELAGNLYEAIGGELREGGHWYRHRTDGRLGAPAFLDDLTALANAALDRCEFTFDYEESLPLAREVTDYILENFSRADSPICGMVAGEGDLPTVPVDLYDNALPSGNSQLASNLIRLGRLTGDASYQQRGQAMLTAMAGASDRYPSSFGNWLHARFLAAAPARELVITGTGAGATAAEFLSDYRPGLLIAAAETDKIGLPLLSGRYLGESLRFFVCENQTCRLPVSTVQAARAQL